MSLLRKALEGETETPPTTVADPAEPTPNEGNQPNNETTTVVMTGPLSQVYTQALAIAFAKPTPEQVEAGQEQQVVAEVALESQANDAIMAAGAFNAVHGAAADAVDNPEALIYGVSAQDIDEDTIVDVATQMSQFELDSPEEFIVVVDATDMAAKIDGGEDPTNNIGNAEELITQPVNNINLESARLLPVLESMVVRMGGRVVYSLKQAMECISELQAEAAEENGMVELPPEEAPEPEVIEPPEAIAPAGTEITEAAEPEPVAPSEPALESAKGGKKDDKKDSKKYEKTTSKLSRAVTMINGQMSKISDSAVRAELHHAVGIVMSAKKDILFAKGKKVALEGQKSGWQVLLEALGEALDPTTVRNVLANLTRSKTTLESLEGAVRKGTATDEKIISACTTTATAIKYGVDLIEAQQKQLKNAKSQVSKLM